jgi:protein Tex
MHDLLLQEFASLSGAAAAVALFEEGATLPFIARYRKERTGGLTEVQLKQIQDRLAYHRALSDRKKTVLDSLREQGALTPDLEKAVAGCREKQALEDLYLPFKPRRKTRAQAAREKGYGPLAELMWAGRPCSGSEEALQGARDILAERIAEHAPTREWVRNYTLRQGKLRSKKKRGVDVDRSKFEAYFDFTEPISRLASHRVLAIDRGEREGVLSVSVDVDGAAIVAALGRTFRLPKVLEDAYERLLGPSIESEIREILRERAEAEAVRVFAENLRDLLLAAPVRGEAILGIDPGLRTGCKVAVIDRDGRYLESTVVFPERAEAADTLRRLVASRGVKRIGYGNGTGSRELEDFLRRAELGVPHTAVSEAGASVYSASDVAVREFPGLDVTVRGAISIARRLQDPLAELVKIEPRSIGVGQYQHDVDQDLLRRELDHVVESCVNAVGVDVNTASVELLSYVAGLTRPAAEKLVAARPFASRRDLKLGPKAFEQAAGFLRIPGGTNPLDASAVHPESYGVVERIAARLGRPLSALIGAELDVRPEDFVDARAGLPTVVDILSELRKPGRDPRREFEAARFDPAVTRLQDVKPGMSLEGVVTNVTGFGAFVDLGVHQDGLVHVSELSGAPRVGQVLKVRVLSVDLELKRIALSMKP